MRGSSRIQGSGSGSVAAAFGDLGQVQEQPSGIWVGFSKAFRDVGEVQHQQPHAGAGRGLGTCRSRPLPLPAAPDGPNGIGPPSSFPSTAAFRVAVRDPRTHLLRSPTPCCPHPPPNLIPLHCPRTCTLSSSTSSLSHFTRAPSPAGSP